MSININFESNVECTKCRHHQRSELVEQIYGKKKIHGMEITNTSEIKRNENTATEGQMINTEIVCEESTLHLWLQHQVIFKGEKRRNGAYKQPSIVS